MKKYIEKETGITASKMLLSFIMNYNFPKSSDYRKAL